MEIFNPIDAEQWRNLISDFDRKRIAFFDNLASLNKTRGATPALEAERKALIKSAKPIQGNIEKLMGSLQSVRGFLKGLGRFFGFGEAPQTMNELGLGPAIIVVGLGAAAVIVRSITSWLVKTAEFAKKNELAQTLAQAGATPSEIIEATSNNLTPGSSAKIFGFDVRWIMAIAALGIGGMYLLKRVK